MVLPERGGRVGAVAAGLPADRDEHVAAAADPTDGVQHHAPDHEVKSDN